METKENRKIQFDEISKNKQKCMNQINNWNKPPPFQYHLINSPTLNFQLATLIPQMHQSLPDFFKAKGKHLGKVPKRNMDRNRFKKLSEQIKQLEQSLINFKDLRLPELLAYKQTLLANYLSKFVEDIEIECLQKGEYLKKIWNLVIRIFEGIFQRILNQNKLKQKEYLQDQMGTHNSYQKKLEQYKIRNSKLKESDNKYQNVIQELMNKIQHLSTQLKGQRILFDKTTSSFAQITHKYEQLKSEYLQILVNGFSSTMTRQQAQNHLNDKQILLFSRQVTSGCHRFRPKKQRQNKSKMINNQMDINLLLEKIQAEDELSLQIDEEVDKQVNYINQRVQTLPLVFQGQNAQVQCDYISRCQEGCLKDKGSQTNPQVKIIQRDKQTQTNSAELFTRKFHIQRFLSIVHYPIRFNDSLKLTRECSKENEINKKSNQMQDAFTSFTIKDISDINCLPSQKNILLDSNEKVKEGKMIKINSRQSNRRSKLYLQRVVKTQSSDFKESNSSQISKKQNKNVRVSSFLILQNLKQGLIKNVSNFKKNQKTVFHLQQKLSINLLTNFKNCRPIKQSLDIEIAKCQGQLQITQKNFFKNMQLAKVNQEIQQKLQSWQILHNKKTISLLPAHKCLKDINQIFKLARKFISLGSKTINLIGVTCDYLSALQGKPVTINNNHKKFIDFFRSCLNLYGEHYIIRNFILLCGLDAPDKDQRLVKMSKISFDSLKQKIDLDRLNRTSEFKFNCDKKDEINQSQSKMIYYSEIGLYFQLLEGLNCSEHKQDLSKYYTTFDRFESAVIKLNQHYKNCNKLIFIIKQAVQLSIEDWGSQTQCKLNIYKCLQLIFDKIIHYKMQVQTQFNHILDQYEGNHDTINKQFINQMVFLISQTETQYTNLTIIAHQTYQLDKMSDLVTFFMIEGLSIDLSNFATVQKDHKIAIIKKLMANQNKKGLLANILQSYQKKRMKKNDFNFLLRKIWIQQSQKVLQKMLGSDLLCLFQGSIPFGDCSIGIGFHKTAFDAFCVS